MNKVIIKEYVEKNYIHKDVIRKILETYEKKEITYKNVVKFYETLKKQVEETKDGDKQ